MLTFPVFDVPLLRMSLRAIDSKIDTTESFKYFCSTVPVAASSTESKVKAREDREEDYDADPAFVRKVFCMFESLDNGERVTHERKRKARTYAIHRTPQQQRAFHAFHAYIKAAAAIFRPENRRVWDRHSSPRPVRQANQKILGIILKRFISRPGMNAKWPLSLYWDFAAARRELWAAYAISCDNNARKDNDWYSDVNWEGCWHAQNRYLLEVIQKWAYAEIRSKIMLTIGTMLSAELTELIFKWAMVAEDAPMNPKTTAIYEQEPSPFGWPTGGGLDGTERIRECYRCSNCDEFVSWLGPLVSEGSKEEVKAGDKSTIGPIDRRAGMPFGSNIDF